MSTDEYVPSDDQVRGRYCDGTYLQTGRTTEGGDFDAWLARVRRDAKAAALQEMQEHHEREAAEAEEPAPPAPRPAPSTHCTDTPRQGESDGRPRTARRDRTRAVGSRHRRDV